MKKAGIIALLCAIVFLTTPAFAYQSPGKPQGFVNDFAQMMSPAAKSSLETELQNFKNETSLEIAIVTIPSLGDETIETYAVELFEEWGIGDEEKDTGILFLIARDEREVRIEVGYGLEGALTDTQAHGIIENVIIPAFREENYDKGIADGAKAIMEVIKGEADYSEVKSSSSGVGNFFGNYGLFIIIILISVLASTKSWWLGGVLGVVAGIVIGFFTSVIVGVIAAVGLAVLGLIIDFVVSKRIGGGRGGGPGGFWGGFGGGSMGGSGGGFSGFGGGMSGGGGASGRW